MPFIDSFQEKIWGDKYQHEGESYEGFCDRIAYSIFPDDTKKAERLKSSLMDFRTLFGGRINSNIGTGVDGLTLFNCFIEATVKNPDSLEGIMDMVTKYALTLKTEGGVGFCANFLRPSNTLIRKIGVTTPGAIKFLEIFDKVSEVITSGSVSKEDSFQGIPSKNSIRKGATMVTMNVNHPDIEEFILAKSVPDKLTKMNMSVLISDAFMYAVDNDMDWDLWFPDIRHEKYDEEWDGNFEKWAEKGYEFVVYRTVKASYLWNLLLKNSFNRNEPGILFIDTARSKDNLSYLKNCSILSTNPCVTEGTLVITPNGIFPVETIVENQKIQTTLGSGSVKDLMMYEEEDLYRVSFSDGFYQDVTKGHIFHTMPNGLESRKCWDSSKRLSEVAIGTFVRKEWYKKFPNLDDNLSRDEGLLVGLYLGDGCFSNHSSFNISSNAMEDNKFIVDLFNRLGGKCRVDSAEGNCERYYFTHNLDYLKNLFNKLNIKPANKTFEICNLVNTNRNFILGLIDGLLCSDGNVNLKARYAQVRFSNSSILLHTLLKHLFLFVKADYKIYTTRKAGEISTIYGREVIRKLDCPEGIIDNDSILNLYNQIKFLSHPEKNEKLKTIIKTKSLNGVKWKTRIKSIELIGRGRVYDLYEPDADDWNHEGYVSRGCAEIFGNTGIVEHKGVLYELGDVCNLGSLVLPRYYDMVTEQFNEVLFKEDASLMVEALDNVIDISNYPLEMYEQASKMKRKIGVGVAGIGSLFMMMGVRYGSDASVEILSNILSIFMNALYQSSARLAKEKGTFELYSEELLQSGFVADNAVLTDETINLIKKYGLRNSALAAIAPNGTLSILAGNVSGGLEPVFSSEYTRWNRVEGTSVPFKYPKVHKGEWFETSYLLESTVADEKILLSVDNTYRVDKNQGLSKKETIRDYGYNKALEYGKTEFTTAMDLSVQEHFNILKLVTSNIDQSASKTINLPADIPFDEFKALYGKIHKQGIKGCTTYREGTSVAILETKREEKDKSIKEQQEEFLGAFKGHENGNIIRDIIKLPEEYPSNGYVLRAEKKKWYVHVAFKDAAKTKPFAIFVNTNDQSPTLITNSAIEQLEKLARRHRLGGKKLDEVRYKFARQQNSVKVARMLGYLLRHNVPMLDIVKSLDSVEDAGVGTFVFRIKKFLMQFITDPVNLGITCSECGSKDVILQEGCTLCRGCGSSKCS